jgi:peptide subunit release factor 1 (eRF1)
MYQKDLDKSKYLTVYSDGKKLNLYEIDSMNNMKKVISNEIRLIGKFKNGGQSANRLQNIRNNNRLTFVNKCVNEINKYLIENIIDGILFCGLSSFKIEIQQKIKFNNISILSLDRIEDNYEKIIESIDELRMNIDENNIIEELKYYGLSDKLVYGKEVKIFIINKMLSDVYVHHTIYDKVNAFIAKNKLKINVNKLFSNYILDFDKIIGKKYF